jgi:hypothetical protein
MGKLLSIKNRALPAANGYVLKGNTDGTQFWGASGGLSTINAVLVVNNTDVTNFTRITLSGNNFTFDVTSRSSGDITISAPEVTARGDAYVLPLQTIITSVS